MCFRFLFPYIGLGTRMYTSDGSGGCCASDFALRVPIETVAKRTAR